MMRVMGDDDDDEGRGAGKNIKKLKTVPFLLRPVSRHTGGGASQYNDAVLPVYGSPC